MQDKELEGILNGNSVDGNAAAKNFYKWVLDERGSGRKTIYIALMLERAGLLEAAVKAFYAVAVHFPKTISYTYYDTPWYVGAASLDRIEQISAPPSRELKMKPVGGRIADQNRYDADIKNDEFSIDPGTIGRA